MVYNNKFVVCVLVNGQPQKELANNSVPIPFGTEYALRFRNKHNRRAVVKIHIDGENVSGNGYIIQPHDSLDILRHADKDAAFKFVSLDSPEAVEHGKNGPNLDKAKGVIEAMFFLEKELPKPPPPSTVVHHYYNPYPRPRPWIYGGYVDDRYYDRYYGDFYGSTLGGGGLRCGSSGPVSSSNPVFGSGGVIGSTPEWKVSNLGGTVDSAGTVDAQDKSLFCASASRSLDTPKNLSESKDGCTVEGSITGQTFYTTYIDVEEEFTSIKLILQNGDGLASASKPSSPNKKQLLCESGKKEHLLNLEKENEDLRIKIAEMERAHLEEKMKRLSSKKKK